MTLWFLVPCHGRFEMARACLRQLRRTCNTLVDGGIEATAVVVADDENLDIARDIGFGTIEQENAPLGRKWNDAYQLACDPSYNPRPADFVVPIGSDDWVDPALILSAPLDENVMTCFRRAAYVREDGRKLARLTITYAGGIGIRVIPRALVAAARYRPAEEMRRRAIDTAVHTGLRKALGAGNPRIVYHELHDLQVVDFKSPTSQLNTYKTCLRFARSEESEDPWGELATIYPAEAIEEMQAVYGAQVAA